jgi:outer membrane protein assembly factor BamE (lipoprotein component of BamABCDE complex)
MMEGGGRFQSMVGSVGRPEAGKTFEWGYWDFVSHLTMRKVNFP